MTNQVYHGPVRQVAGRDIFNITSPGLDYWDWSTEDLLDAEARFRAKLNTARWEMLTSPWLLLMVALLLGAAALLLIVVAHRPNVRGEFLMAGMLLQAVTVAWPMHRVERDRRIYGRAIRGYKVHLSEIEQVLFERR